MAKIFISYRRDDGHLAATVIHRHLAAAFPPWEIFFDVDSIPPGHDFPTLIAQKVGTCDYVIVVIGRTWLTVSGKSGGRRLDDPADYVRLEIETALKRDIPVIPVLVDGAMIPEGNQLPASLSSLANRQALPLRPGRDFTIDLQRLASELGEQESQRQKRLDAERQAEDLRQQEEARRVEEERRHREAAVLAEKQRLERDAPASEVNIQEDRAPRSTQENGGKLRQVQFAERRVRPNAPPSPIFGSFVKITANLLPGIVLGGLAIALACCTYLLLSELVTNWSHSN